MITIGTSSSDWLVYKGLAKDYPHRIYYSVGLHPGSVTDQWEAEVDQFERILKQGDSPMPIAIGEIGLDYFRLPKDKTKADQLIGWQQAAFARQLQIAKGCKLPIIIHSRSAFDDCVRMIDQSGVNWDRVVFHCFSEGANPMERINLRGGRGSFTGNITYEGEAFLNMQRALKEQGTEKLMFETDAPYLTPVPHKGSENSPALIVHTAEFAAKVLQMQVDELLPIVYKNTLNFFDIEE